MPYSRGSRTTYSRRYGSNRYSARYKKRAHNYAKKSLRKSYKRRNTRTGGFTGIELKFYDSWVSLQDVDSFGDASGGEHDPVALALNTIPQGDGESQRIGRVATVKSIHVFGHIRAQQLIATVDTPVEVMFFIALVQDKQTNGAQLQSEQVFVNPSGSLLLAANPMKNLQNASRFTIVHQMQMVMQPTIGVVATGAPTFNYNGQILPFSFTKKCNVRTIYNGTTEIISNITDNSFHVIAWASEQNETPSNFTISYNCRIRFVG